MSKFGLGPCHILSHCGGTLGFPHAGISATLDCDVPPGDWPTWWRISQQVMHQLSSKQVSLKHWLQQADLLQDKSIECTPVVAWYQALLASLAVPPYLQKVSCIEEAGSSGDTVLRIRLDSACPYDEVAQLALQLTRTMLNWANTVRQQRQFNLPGAQLQAWLHTLVQLTRLLPSPEVMAFHHDLWRAGITWHWLGEDRTQVGQGVKQRLCVGAAALELLGDANAWRIPIYTVTGSVGKTTTARLLAQLLQSSGQRLALTASDGAWLGAVKLIAGDCIGGVTARDILRHPGVEVAVFEQGRGGLVKQGVPYTHSDVAILLNAQAVHLGLDGVDTVEAMADVKAIGLRPARLVVMNLDDAQCQRLGALRDPGSCVWFSVEAGAEILQSSSLTSAGVLGVQRSESGEPQALSIWQAGRAINYLSLKGVAPYQGLLGEKTLEELLAAVAAAWFGPLQLNDWGTLLRELRLDSDNHLFRTSVHKQEKVVFVLDKAGEGPSLKVLAQAVDEIAKREGAMRRIAVFCRSAGEPPQRHRESCQWLYRFMDEFICFDRADTYTSPVALPIYAPGSIRVLLQEELLRLNAQGQTTKPVTMVEDWTAAEAFLRERFTMLEGKTLVLVNQPSTAATELNEKILSFVGEDHKERLNDV